MSKVKHIRVKTRMDMGRRARGQDLMVSAVLDDGTEAPLLNVLAIHVFADARSEYVTGVLVMHGVELDGVEATITDDAVKTAKAEAAFWKAEAERLSAATGSPLRGPLGQAHDDYFKKLFPTK